MSLPEESCLTGEILEEGSALSVEDLTRLFAVEERRIVEWVEEGVITVLEMDVAQWRFSGAQLRRARIALRLERDLGVNAAGVALALELLEELEQFRRERRSARP
jgi:chaperone modulatory protein CbpM